jgi:hypothetical protein
MTQRRRGVLMPAGLIALAVILTGFYQPLQAQVGTASLNGAVSDSSGGAIPGATVSLDSMTRKLSRQAATSDVGTYVFTSLEPDTYQLVVTAKGFTTQTIQNVVLASGQGSTLNVSMVVGTAVTELTVAEKAPLLETTTATLGSEVDSQQLTTLPLLGRSFTDMMLILPGASPPNLTYWSNYAPGGGGESGGGDVAFYGQRPRDNSFSLDGMLNAELLFDGVPMYPPPESIGEMKVESGMDSGAYGYASGANIEVVTKAGTKNYHLDAWDYVRNDDFNARNYFDPTVNRIRWNQFGFSGGGPLYIPHVVSKERAWYVFGWYEGLRYPTTSNTYALVPTTAELAGDFSADPPIYNPYTSVVNSSGSLVSRSPFAGNQIPVGATSACSPNPTCFDPAALAIATKFLPAQNLPTFSGPGATDWLGTTIGTNTYDQWSARVDHQFGAKDTIYGRYSDARNPSTSVTFPNLPSISHLRVTNSVASETHTFSPTFVLTTRLGWQRFNDSSFTGGPSIANTIGTFNAFPIAFAGIDMIPPIVIDGFGGISQGFGYYGPENTIMWTVDTQKIKGRHTLGFGGWIVRDAYKTNNQTGTEVDFSVLPTSAATAGSTGYGLATYFLGLPSTAGRVIGSTEGDMFTHYYALYAQDSMRATKKLTFNLGLRYDYSPVSLNRHGSGTFEWETGQYVYDLPNPITGSPANAPRGLISPDHRNFEPRVGLAYQISPKTTARASYAIFMDMIGENPQEQQGNRGNWPFSFPQSVAGLNTGLPQYYLENPFPGPAAGSATPLGCQQCLEVYKSATRTPYVQQWSLSVQQQLNPTLMMQVAYFGSHGIDQLGQIVDNTAVVPGLGPYQNRQLWPQFPPYVNNGFNQFPSWYDGMSVELRKTTSHNLTYLVTYTYSKTIDVMDSLIVGNIYPFAQPDRFDISQFRGPASYDVTHRLTASYTWGIPGKTGNRLADAVVANWNFSGVYTFDSGSPYYVLLESDNANIGGVGGRLTSLTNLVGNPILPHRTIQEWFNTNAYQIPPFGTQGDAGKHALYSDGMNNFDLALSKRWPFKETRDVEIRGEFFNGFNNHSFSPPGYVEDQPSSFGVIGGVRQGGRQMQVALKLHF